MVIDKKNLARIGAPIARALADPAVRRQLRTAYEWVQSTATSAGEQAGERARHSLDEVMSAAGYERRPTRTSVAFERAGWLGTGAALAAATYLGSKMDAETGEHVASWVRSTLDEVGSEARAAADASADALAAASTRLVDDLLDTLALQRKEPAWVEVAKAAGWVGLGVAVGAGAFALIAAQLEDEGQQTREHARKDSPRSSSGATGKDAAPEARKADAGKPVTKTAARTTSVPKTATRSGAKKTGTTETSAAKAGPAKTSAAKAGAAKTGAAKKSTRKAGAAKKSTTKAPATRTAATTRASAARSTGSRGNGRAGRPRPAGASTAAAAEVTTDGAKPN